MHPVLQKLPTNPSKKRGSKTKDALWVFLFACLCMWLLSWVISNNQQFVTLWSLRVNEADAPQTAISLPSAPFRAVGLLLALACGGLALFGFVQTFCGGRQFNSVRLAPGSETGQMQIVGQLQPQPPIPQQAQHLPRRRGEEGVWDTISGRSPGFGVSPIGLGPRDSSNGNFGSPITNSQAFRRFQERQKRRSLSPERFGVSSYGSPGFSSQYSYGSPHSPYEELSMPERTPTYVECDAAASAQSTESRSASGEDCSDEVAAEESEKLERRLQRDLKTRIDLAYFAQKMRMWISQRLLAPLIRRLDRYKMAEANFIQEEQKARKDMAGVGGFLGGGFGGAQDQNAGGNNSRRVQLQKEKAALDTYLKVIVNETGGTSNPSEVEKRLRMLAEGQCVNNFDYNETHVASTHPCDATLLITAFVAYLQELDPSMGDDIFLDKTFPSTKRNSSSRGVCIVQARKPPLSPYYFLSITVKKSRDKVVQDWRAEPGADNGRIGQIDLKQMNDLLSVIRE